METIDDIVRKMRTLGRLDEKSTDKIPRSLQALGLRIYADRIEAAYKRLAIPTPEQWTEIARQSVEMYDLKRENASLRAALKPVLEVEMDMYTSNLSIEIAINEAKRIFWSSSAKGKGGD